MSAAAESTLVEYPIRMAISIPIAAASPQSIRTLLTQSGSFFDNRPALLNNIVAVKIVNQSADFNGGTINAAGDGWEAGTTQVQYAASDLVPYSEPFVVTAGMDIEALRAVGGVAVSAIAICYLTNKQLIMLDHSTVEVPV